ncbi:MAG: hypothetical protein KJN63_11500 [Acidimicrobiia bacterium]|nr:hypothetical protein [Acidimicrobiia bacterium]
MTPKPMKNRMVVARIAAALALAALMLSMSATTVSAKANVDRVEGPFETVVPVAFADNPAGVELMFVECDFVQRVTKPDGSAKETQKCHLTRPFFVFPGEPPTRAFNPPSGACLWFSDYMQLKSGEEVWADGVKLTVTPSGRVNVTTTYPAEPLQC